MAKSRRNANVLPRILGLMLLIVGLSLVGLLWFDILGIVDARSVALPVLKMVGLSSTDRKIDAENPLLMDQERLMKQKEEYELHKEELALQESEIKKQNEEILQKQNSLAESQKALDDQMNSFNEQKKQAEDKRANLEQNAAYLNSMPPAKAVQILLQMEDQDVIDLFRIVEELAKAQGTGSIVSAWLALMPPDRAATISRKMSRKPGN